MATLANALVELWADARAHPRAALLELGSLVVSVALFVGTLVALATGLPSGRGGPYLAVIVAGTAFVLFWTVGYPLYDRVVRPSA